VQSGHRLIRRFRISFESTGMRETEDVAENNRENGNAACRAADRERESEPQRAACQSRPRTRDGFAGRTKKPGE
jgi:hypothetical protein